MVRSQENSARPMRCATIGGVNRRQRKSCPDSGRVWSPDVIKVGEKITVDEVAELAGTIGYEILTGFTGRLPRVWMEDGGD